MPLNIRTWLTLLLLCLATTVSAQLMGVVVDRESGDSIPMASLIYKGHHVSVACDEHGRFSIARHEGWTLTVKAVGYKNETVTISASTPHELVVRLRPDTKKLEEVVVKSKRRSKYSRKNNPAVELMKRVVEAKRRTDLENHDFYSYDKYQKITLAVNDVTPSELEEVQAKNQQWMLDQVEMCPLNNKLILPLSVDETVSKHIYRKDPKSAKDIITGQRSKGVNQLIETGNILNTMLKDAFTDVDIYDDQIRLLQYPFTSPIGKDAVAFYRFYIEDTVYVGRDLCYHLQFTPNNQQDFGFRGELFILADSSLHVKRCNLSIPKRSDVNFVENMRIEQEYTQLDNGEWVLTVDNMIVEMALTQFLSKAVVIRSTYLHDYAFDPLPKKLFKGKAKKTVDPSARMRDDQFWGDSRQVELTKSESSMDEFINNMTKIKGFKYILFGAKALIENHVELGGGPGKQSKFDIGPINTIVSSNFVDGIRFRASGQTTAALNPHLFWKGYYAYGRDTKNHYYSSLLTYSFNKKNYLPAEFPIRTLSFSSAYDVMSPSDKFLYTDKDNVFTAFRWKKVDQMYFYSRQELKFDWETEGGLRTIFSAKAESNEPTGELAFNRVADGAPVSKIRTTEATATIIYCPGRTYINTKQHRLPINFDAPEFSITHTMGFDGLLGGQYRYNFTELGIYKRFWLKSWGKLDCRMKAGAQWNKVPFPLLIMPPSNLSYIIEEGTFALMGNMEFLNDRYATIDLNWDINGKLFNRIPFLQKLKWREVVGIKGMIGHLTDKNNPRLAANANSDYLFTLPADTYLMNGGEPYWEVHAGIHNILKFFEIDYVRRLSYTGNKGAVRHGVRIGFQFTF
ncbi:MAG: carboxypeptidase-like regulatory domain-containing protein [Prevotella sp.]|nr:carboxypeptidase-like regulatory domain-containing protein [Prevotella sp.]